MALLASSPAFVRLTHSFSASQFVSSRRLRVPRGILGSDDKKSSFNPLFEGSTDRKKTQVAANTDLKLGKLPAEKDAVAFKFKRYVDWNSDASFNIPTEIGDYTLVSHWGALGNDEYNSSVFAALAHLVTLRGRAAGTPVEFTDDRLLENYKEAIGLTHDTDLKVTETTDAGIDFPKALEYFRKTGISDYRGTRHFIGGYAALKPRKVDQLAVALRLFGPVLVGLDISTRAQYQFRQGELWDANRRGSVIGSQAVLIVGRNAEGNFLAVSWGKLIELTPDFYEKYNDEAYATFTREMLTGEDVVPAFRRNIAYKDLRALPGFEEFEPVTEPDISGLDEPAEPVAEEVKEEALV